jgi:predicted dehydrogenase
MDMGKLSVGVVGCGFRAREYHLPAYRDTDLPVSIDCVCDLNGELATRAAEQFDVPAQYRDISEMLKREEIDIVDVCVPPQGHASVALEAIRNGCDVFVEKPLALNTEECDTLLGAAEEHGAKLGVMHNMLYNKPFVTAKRQLAAGRIGELTGVRILLTNPHDGRLAKPDHWYHDLPGGIMTETLPHIAYLTTDLLGSVDNVDVTAKQAMGFDWAPHDEFEIVLENPSVACSTRLSYSGTLRTLRIDILGTDGYLQVDMLENALYTYDLRSMDVLSLGRHSISQLGQRAWNLLDNVADVVRGNATSGSTVVLEDFVQSVRDDRPPLVDGEDGKQAVSVLEKAVQSYDRKYGDGTSPTRRH